MTDPAAQIEETSPRDAVHLLEAHHALMQSLFSPESNNFLELQELLQPEIHFRLETGDTLKAAHRLYEKHGFTFRGPFGEYPDLPESLFMEKRLF